ncbi:MAG: chemotaxis protein CheA [Lachnospiraceae bacterium]|nr:chemotaxis protein CheA [Lachnospiraceae bacterium]
MADDMITEGMLDMFIFETEQGLENLENICLDSKDVGEFDEDNVNEIFRIMHTIKGASAVMMYQNIATLSHKLEDVFYFIRENHPESVPHAELVDDVLEVSDFITSELEKIKDGLESDGDSSELISTLDVFLKKIQKKTGSATQPAAPVEERPLQEKPRFYIAPVASDASKFYNIYITYLKDTEMANIRAYMAVNSLKGIAEDIMFSPSDIISNPDSANVVLEFGFKIALQTTEDAQRIMELINSSAGIENVEINECTSDDFLEFCVEAETPSSSAGEVLMAPIEQPTIRVESQKPQNIVLDSEEEKRSEEKSEGETEEKKPALARAAKRPAAKKGEAQSFISVNIKKMDLLMDLIGELVIAEAVVLQNPDLKVPGLDLTNFQKSAAQLSKITSELQDAIMAMRMMPLKNTFQKMNRIVYDTSKKLGKDIELEVIGEDTEVDKNIIEHISDPLMHLIRNSVDHGIESNEKRAQIGKIEKGKIVLEAKNEGGQVWISVSDNGKGLNKEEILEKAKSNGLLGNRSEKDFTDKEIYNFITLPGFSTKKQVTEYSGRGVGMDVVVKNIQGVGGVLDIESTEGRGSTMTMKIPLTLAIIDGIIFSVGGTNFVTPTNTVSEFIRIDKEKLIVEPDGEEYVMIRDDCYPLIRLNKFYHLKDAVDDIEDGIVVVLNHEDRKLAVFADKLVGEQEIVVKPIPSYIKQVKGISGCTQLGDGSISLILDTGGLVMV